MQVNLALSKTTLIRMIPAMQNSDQHILTISELNRLARGLMETHFQSVWVEGEISNFVRPASGHWYFSLKDEGAQIRCSMFRNANQHIKFIPENGMHVVVRAKVSIYEPRGDYQLIANHIEEIGFGALQRAFEQLKSKLEKEGLFDEEHKKPIPEFPKQIGVVTSSTGAAVRDILNVLKRRFPLTPVIIYPTMVQGDEASAKIVQAIKLANKRQECDVLLLARGGGSIEDLWPFNEEMVARAVFDSTLPIISGVGHEIDFTIADFVADLRAPTPSAAAELASPNQNEILQQLSNLQNDLTSEIKQQLSTLQSQTNYCEKRLMQCHPATQLQQQAQKLDQLEQQLLRLPTLTLERYQTQVNQFSLRLTTFHPKQLIEKMQSNVKSFEEKLFSNIQLKFQQTQSRFENCVRALNTVSPLATLERGYAMVTDHQNQIVKDVKSVKIGDTIKIRLAHGKLESKITKL